MTGGDASPEERAEGEDGTALARRRLYAVETGLLVVPDRDGELAALSREYAELGERFRAAYRDWQSAEREEAAGSANL